MAEFAGAIGNGIAGLVEGSLRTISGVLRGMVSTVENALPGGWLFVIVFVVLLGGAWMLARR